MTTQSAIVLEMLDRIVADVETRTDRQEDELEQCAAAFCRFCGPFDTAHKLATMAQEYFEFAVEKKGIAP